ncbi:sensor histidine kinase [Brevibacillus sp. SYSU BS000544]|uniref:sensor histidine kinase n=1 Tax=Brevibacillus sp. SYSU BS000544 TaxID=3416443 RepID=UPI003CE5737D
MDSLTQFFLMNVPEAFVILVVGLTLFNQPLQGRWRQVTIFALSYAFSVFLFDFFGVIYEIKVVTLFVIMNLLIRYLFNFPFLTTGLISASSFVMLVAIEFMVLLLFQFLHIGINEIMANPLYLYSAMWSIFALSLVFSWILRRFNLNLIRLFSFSKLNTYLSLLVVFIMVELLVILSTATHYYLADENKLDVVKIHNIPILIPVMLIVFILIVIVFTRYLSLKKKSVMIETEDPYLKSIDDMMHTLRSIQNEESMHYQAILELLKQQEYEKASNYVEKIFSHTDTHYRQFARLTNTEINDPAVAYLLQTKMAYCLANKLIFTYDVQTTRQFSHMKSIDTIKLLGNLLDNAIRAAKGDPVSQEVHMSWLDNGQEELLLIRNSGPTIPQQYMSRLFDLGFTTKKSNGGAGLSIVNAIVKKYRGSIHVTSEDNVTVFQIVFTHTAKSSVSGTTLDV